MERHSSLKKDDKSQEPPIERQRFGLEMESSFLMASCSGTLHLHDLKSQNLLDIPISSGSCTSSLSWNHNDTILASCGKTRKVYYHDFSVRGPQNSQIYLNAVVSSIKFSNLHNKILYTIDNNGCFYVHNLQYSQGIISTQEIPCYRTSTFSCNFEDSIFTFGCENLKQQNCLLITKNSSSDSSCNLTPIHSTELNEVVMHINFHRSNPGLLSFATNVGRVSLMDVPTCKILHSFGSEKACQSTGLCFSDHRDMLVASFIDGHVCFYHAQKNKLIKNFSLEDSITSLDFFASGQHLAIGTATGKIDIFDIRKLQGPTSSFKHHNSFVQQISCQRKVMDLDSLDYHDSHLERGIEMARSTPHKESSINSNFANSRLTTLPLSSQSIFSPAKPAIRKSDPHLQYQNNFTPIKRNGQGRHPLDRPESTDSNEMISNVPKNLEMSLFSSTHINQTPTSFRQQMQSKPPRPEDRLDTSSSRSTFNSDSNKSSNHGSSPSSMIANHSPTEDFIYDLREQIHDERVAMQRYLIRQNYSQTEKIKKLSSCVERLEQMIINQNVCSRVKNGES